MTTMSKMITALRQKLGTATTALHDEIGRLRQEIEDKCATLQQAHGAPYPPDELTERMREWLHAHFDHLQHEYGRLVPHAMGPTEPQPHAPAQRDDVLLFLLLRDMLDAAIPSFVKRLGDYAWGPPAGERPALIARLEHELVELEQVEERIVDEAAASGIVIAHRPEVQQRREREARQRQLEEQAAVARAQRERALNVAHEEQRSRGRVARWTRPE